MNLVAPNQILQLVAWLVALIEFSAGLYVLLLNVWHNANRHVSALLLLSAVSTVTTGMLMTATYVAEATLPLIIQAMTTPAIMIGLLIVSVVLLKPNWLHGRRLWLWLPLYGLGLLPVILTIVDVQLGTQLWYTGPGKTYVMGGMSISQYAAGRIALPLRAISNYLAPVATLIFSLCVALFDKKAASPTRRLARLIFGVLAFTSLVQFGLRGVLGIGGATLVTSLAYAAVYAYAGFQQMVSERRGQRGRLQTRLVLLILAITLPLLAGVILFVTNEAGILLEQDAAERMDAARSAVEAGTSVWLDLNIKALGQLVNQPDIINMNTAQQKLTLQALAAAFPHMYLVSTTDLKGMNVARNDSAALADYSDRQWFRGARDGAPLTFQSLIGRTNNKPALAVSMPIKDKAGNIVGVGMFATELTKISQNVEAVRLGNAGYAYLVDADNKLVAHSRPAFLTTKDNQLVDAAEFPPVQALRRGEQGAYSFTDENGVRWQADIAKMDYGWGVIVQQPEDELFGALRVFQGVSWATLVVGILLLSAMAWLTIRQALQPIGTLTDTATTIAAGDLTRTAPVESEDEFGTLARAFNSMTGQLRGLIGSLEQRVAERTADLERRSRYLEATAEVGRAASSILESDQLIRQAAELIRERFDLYYVGLFLVDETGEWAVLRAGTGEAGRAMLARGHRLQVGSGSMIGWSIANAQARIALEAGEDAVRLATRELPDTRSEAALPLRSRGRVFGALTVQSSIPDAFDQAIIIVLQTMADQVSAALDNARLFAESQAALETVRRASGELSRRAWTELVHARPDLGYRSAEGVVTHATDIWRPEMEQAVQKGQTIRPGGTGDGTRLPLAVPIKVRGNVIGVLDTYKPEGRDWTSEEIAALETLADQLGAALESARLYQDSQQHAAQERLVGEVTARMRETLDLDTVLQTAIREMGDALGMDAIEVRMRMHSGGDDHSEG